MERVLAKTRFNNTEYTILQRNQNIEFTSNRNNVENKNLNENEIAILSYIYNYICVNPKTLQFMGDIKISSNTYSMFIDTRTRLYTLLLKKDGKYYEPPVEITKQFNLYFNDQPDIFFEKNTSKNIKLDKDDGLNDEDDDLANCYDNYDEEILPETEYNLNAIEPYYDSGMDEEVDDFDEETLKTVLEIRKKRLKKSYFRTMIKSGKIAIATFIATGVCFATLPRILQFGVKNAADSIMTIDFKKTDKNYSYNDVVEAVNSNPNITEGDKAFLKEILYKEFQENKDYINLPVFLDRLKTLNVEYKKRKVWNEEKQEYESVEKDIEPISSAYYASFNNKIVCFDYVNVKNPKIYDEEYNNRVYDFYNARLTDYAHELNHLQTIGSIEANFSAAFRDLGFDYETYLSENYDMEGVTEFDENENYIGCYYRFKIDDLDLKKLKYIQSIKNNATIFYNDLYYETINEIFAREYYAEYGDNHPKRNNNSKGYESDVPYMYLLAEILPDDVLREYKYNNNISILINGLKEIDGKSNKAYELISSINCINFYERRKEIMLYGTLPGNTAEGEECSYGLSIEEQQELSIIEEEIKENYKKIHDNFAYFYNMKYNRNMSNDMIMVSYLFMTPCVTEKERENFRKFLNVEQGTIKSFKARGYFSEYYKTKHPCVTFVLENGETIEDYEIGEHNRYQPTKEENIEER